MAIDDSGQPCTIVLHETPVSKECVLCGTNVLAQGALGYLDAPGAKVLCVAPKDVAPQADEVSVHTSLAKRFGFENRMKANIRMIEDPDRATATHVELLFRDQHLSRADMWRIKAQVDDSVLYEGQKLRYLGSVTADVEAIYIAGQRVDSAYVIHPRTKLIFRSGSARFTLLVQISREMLDHWIEGDLMYERLLSGLLPALFQRWDALKVRHHISVVFFGRFAERGDASDENGMIDSPNSPKRRNRVNDFYHVVDEDVNGGDWRDLIRRLKQLFNNTRLPRQTCVAAKGNMLEAIHLAATDFTSENIDLHLTSTGSSIIAVTAGSGMFEADHESLKRTTELLMGNGIGVDIVSLSLKPLHPVPIFHYTREGVDEYALPHWVDMSYWPPSKGPTPTAWLIPETLDNVHDIAIEPLKDLEGKPSKSAGSFMDAADDLVFSKPQRANQIAFAVHQRSASNTSGPAEPSTNGIAGLPSEDQEIRDQSDDLPPTPKKRLSAEQPSASIPSIQRAKREGLGPHPLLNTGRKISVGPRGLAPGRGVATSTVSAQHAQHEKDLAPAQAFTSNAASSGLAKQIRASLARKTSQSSLNSRSTAEPTIDATLSKPIRIQSREQDLTGQDDDPAGAIESKVLAGRDEHSLSATPKGKRDSLPLPGMNALEDDQGSVSPWLTLLNPCNPRRDNMRVASEYRKWQHVFPRAVAAGEFKWDSMSTPAALPLMTEYRISSAALERHFAKKIRRLVAKSSQRANVNNARRILFELVSMRLDAGFQIVPRRTSSRHQSSLKQIDRVLLSLGSFYHDLSCLSDAEVQIIEYERIRGDNDDDTATQCKPAVEYAARVRSSMAKDLKRVDMSLSGHRDPPNWAQLDEQSVNPAALAEGQGSTVVRFVLIPVSFSKDHSPGTVRELADDERRIEGIQKLTQLWQRHRYFTEEDQRHHASMVKSKIMLADDRDPNPLAVEYHTRDPSMVVKALGPALADDTINDATLIPLISDSDVYHSSDFDTAKLVKHMQEPPPDGIEFKDRWWLTRLHHRCFRGDEMTNWLLRVFKDLENREDAVKLGNQLKDIGIFAHVRNRHDFRDGHYFYQIKGAHRTTDYPDSAGIFSKAMGRSVPPTPISETRPSPLVKPMKESHESSKVAQTPVLAPVDVKEVFLSQMLQYNVDTTKRSTQLEIVNLHYDRIHNPDNCYHIQLDWTSTTAKLIRESVSRWTGLVESHGLKLVQVPVHEAVRLQQDHPFDVPVAVKLAVRPPQWVAATPRLEPHGSSPRAGRDPESYHKAVLRKSDFVLDFEAARNFPSNIQARYSWSTQSYELTQFVHKSGLVLVQISNNAQGDFMLVPNLLALHSMVPGRKPEGLSAAEIVSRFVAFCHDEKALRALFEESNRKSISTPSPLANAALGADAEIPPFQLPPELTLRNQK